MDEFTATFEGDFVLNGQIVDDPRSRWSPLVGLYQMAKAGREAAKRSHSMAKLHRMKSQDGEPLGYMLFCPGCRCGHAVYVDQPSPHNGARWTFNGNVERPTFMPSLHIPGRCHSYVADGRIRFLPDSTHALAGQTVELPDADDW